jgi:fructosamine-3-kinase
VTRSISLPEPLVGHLDVRSVTPVPGGGIAEAYRVDTAEGPAFVKLMRDAPPGLFEREATGLHALRAAGALGVPEVLRTHESGLVLEWVEVDPDRTGDGGDFGRALAALHGHHGRRFGSIDARSHSYVGSVPVDLTPRDTWAESYLGGRVLPLAQRCVRLGLLDPDVLLAVDRLLARGEELCGPPEPPSLVHGDLWAGNWLVDTTGRHWVIDPSVSWSHRELDLAMMQMFSGFGEDVFTAYREAAPLAEGWEARVDLHQLLPLLVHVILFGDPYAAQVVRALGRLGR